MNDELKLMFFNEDFDYRNLSSLDKKEIELVPELSDAYSANLKSNDYINNVTDTAISRIASDRKSQVANATIQASMSALGLLSAHTIASNAKAKNEKTYERNINSIENQSVQAGIKIGTSEALGRKNIFTAINKDKSTINSNLLKDPRVLSTSNMSELQGAEGRINQAADINLASNKMTASDAKLQLQMDTLIAKEQQKAQKWSQQEAIEAQKTSSIQQGIMGIATAGASLI